MDVVSFRVGVIDHINHEKSIIHVLVALGIDGTCAISLFDGQASIGDAVAERLAQHHSKQGIRSRIVAIEPTDQALSLRIFAANFAMHEHSTKWSWACSARHVYSSTCCLS